MHSLIFTPYHPKKNLDSTICLSPNLGPKVEKKHTGVMAIRLTKKMIRTVSTKPREKTGYARAPMAKEDTTRLAESHCASCQRFNSTPKFHSRIAYHGPDLGHASI